MRTKRYPNRETPQPQGYGSSYTGLVRDLYDQLSSRPGFQYDINADALYDQYRRSYSRQGQLAMEDTMARAQAMTGGYGNSYAQTAGQQTYQNYLSKITDAIPGLYYQALQRYQMEGNALKDRYDLAKAAENQDYQRYRDRVSDDQWEKALRQDQENEAYDRAYQQGKDAYQRQQDAYTRLSRLIQQGYWPTDAELEEAGMTRAQANAWL